MAKTVVTLPTTPSWTVIALQTITWILSGGWKDANFAWEDETRNWEHMGMLGRDSD